MRVAGAGLDGPENGQADLEERWQGLALLLAQRICARNSHVGDSEGFGFKEGRKVLKFGVGQQVC